MTGRKTLTLSLVSHTNVGKTTLARTLLQRDVGEVRDQAHTTLENERFVLIATDQAELVLWDTPGFGDSVRLLQRLRRRANPLAWFLQQVWDRVVDRALWSSQQAALNVQQEADVVLYLVNATEEPEAATYVDPELELLSWIGRPVLLLLNQGGPAAAADGSIDRWRRHVGRWEIVRDALSLDGFSRCWVQELVLFDRLEALLPEADRSAMRELAAAWRERHLVAFQRASAAIASYLAETASDRCPLPSRRPSRSERRRAMRQLAERLERRTASLMAELIAVHGLEGEVSERLEREVDAFVVWGEEKLSAERGALVGGVVSGALGGLAADALAGGLTFGGGAVAGAILGALGGAGLARGIRVVWGGEAPSVGWSETFLERLAVQTVLRYVAVAHYGRGRGVLSRAAAPERWRDAVTRTVGRHRWRWADGVEGASGSPADGSALEAAVRGALREILVEAYPEAARFLPG